MKLHQVIYKKYFFKGQKPGCTRSLTLTPQKEKTKEAVAISMSEESDEYSIRDSDDSDEHFSDLERPDENEENEEIGRLILPN